MNTTITPEWIAEQVCGECGIGAFQRATNGDALCEECGHEHPMDPWNLGEREHFTWLTADGRNVETLHVAAYAL